MLVWAPSAQFQFITSPITVALLIFFAGILKCLNIVKIQFNLYLLFPIIYNCIISSQKSLVFWAATMLWILFEGIHWNHRSPPLWCLITRLIWLPTIQSTVLTSLAHVLELTLIGNLHLIKLDYLLLALYWWRVVLISFLSGLILTVTDIMPCWVLRNSLLILLLLKGILKIENVDLIDISWWTTLTFHQLLVYIITTLKVHSIHIYFNLILYWHFVNYYLTNLIYQLLFYTLYNSESLV